MSTKDSREHERNILPREEDKGRAKFVSWLEADFCFMGWLIKMNNRYTAGNKRIKKVSSQNQFHFDWVMLIAWLATLVISFEPLYVSIIKYYELNHQLDNRFWCDAFMHEDILWVFGTVLLFTVFDSLGKKRIRTKKWVKALNIIGIAVLIFTEVIWVLFDNFLTTVNVDNEYWPICLGMIIVVFILLIATPLKLEVIREEN